MLFGPCNAGYVKKYAKNMFSVIIIYCFCTVVQPTVIIDGPCVTEYVKKYAKEEGLCEDDEISSSGESSMSEFSENEAENMDL